MQDRHKLIGIAGAVLLSLSLFGCGANKNSQNKPKTTNNSAQVELAQQANDQNIKASKLAKLNYVQGKPDVIHINHNRAQLNKHMWKHDGAKYRPLDNLKRTSRANIADLDKKNVANDALRVRQTVKPTGYVQKFINNEAVVNRGHEIAYSLSKGIDQKGKYNPKHKSGDQNNPRNLFTQTAFSNQELQTVYESKVRNALKDGEKVIYQVHPIFQGNDEMPKGVQLEALSTNHKLDFNVYIFNIQPKLKFNYKNGQSSTDNQINPAKLPGSPTFHDNNNNGFMRRGYRRYPRRFYRHHHYFRHYAEYRVARHLLHHHMYRHRYYPRRRYYRRPMIRRRMIRKPRIRRRRII